MEANGSPGEFQTGNFILTNHHSVRPAPEPFPTPPVGLWRNAVRFNDSEHSKPVATILRPCGCSGAANMPLCPYEVEYQRLRTKQNTLLRRGASTAEIDRLIPQYRRFGQQCRSFAGQVIGRVWATSGLEVSSAGHRLDWAIIKVDGDSECENLVCVILPCKRRLFNIYRHRHVAPRYPTGPPSLPSLKQSITPSA